MPDYALQAPTKAVMDAALVAAAIDRPYTHNWALDVIGTLYVDAVYVDGIEVTPPVALPGYHANLRLLNGMALPASLLSLVITPVSSQRVWA